MSRRRSAAILAGVAEQYEPPAGFHIVKAFPVDWDGAIADLWWNGQTWAEVTLTNVDLGAAGEDRTRNAEVVVEFYGPSEGSTPGVWGFPFPLDQVMGELEKARAWLLENERGRQPVDQGGLSAAGAAFSKMSVAEQTRWTESSTKPDGSAS